MNDTTTPRTKGRRRMEQLYEEQIGQRNERIRTLEADLLTLRMMAEHEVPASIEEVTTADAKLVATELLAKRSMAAAFRLKAEELAAELNRAKDQKTRFADRLGRVVLYVTDHFQHLADHSKHLIALVDGAGLVSVRIKEPIMGKGVGAVTSYPEKLARHLIDTGFAEEFDITNGEQHDAQEDGRDGTQGEEHQPAPGDDEPPEQDHGDREGATG